MPGVHARATPAASRADFWLRGDRNNSTKCLTTCLEWVGVVGVVLT